jgi:CHAT domain-containing protein
MFSDRIKDFAEGFDVEDLILRFDVDFDIPLRHGYAIGIFRMVDAYAAVTGSDPRSYARRVGASWCDIVRADVEYDMWGGLNRVEESRADAQFLLRSGPPEQGRAGRFVAYSTARWFDGAGRIRYRLGSYTRARIDFETAVGVAEDSGLWWCLPDMRSNLLRARFEEAKQSRQATADPERLVQQFQEERRRLLRDAHVHRIVIHKTGAGASVRKREYMRGYSSVLHNLAVALRDLGRTNESLAVSRESLRVSRALGDEYRIGQSTNHQALIHKGLGERDEARRLLENLRDGQWRRGQRIARQQLADFVAPIEAAREIKSLLADIDREGASSAAGMDIDIHAYTVGVYETIVKKLGDREDEEAAGFRKDVARQRLAMARQVRQAVALPMYKRAWNKAIRPSFQQQIAQKVIRPAGAGGPSPTDIEEAFGLAEESSGRELLDMLSAAGLPRLDLPPFSGNAQPRIVPPSAEIAPEDDERSATAEPGRRSPVRRSAVRRTDPANKALLDELARRETEFEDQFLRQPLEAAPHDPEIAHRVRMYTVNNRGKCLVRYFTFTDGDEVQLGAFVFKGNTIKHEIRFSYREVTELARSLSTERAPDRAQCERIWTLLIHPIWKHITAGADPEHLVIIPSDIVFSIPVHVAMEPGDHRPLAARVPMSQSVSATAFIGRGRHLLQTQPVDDNDDLAAIIVADDEAIKGRPGVNGSEVLQTNWPAQHMMIVGDRPQELPQHAEHERADLDGLAAITEAKPEFFVYAGHGSYNPAFEELGPYLELHGNYLTQYDIALRLRLPRNKLTVLGACMAGQATQSGGGDVVGFLRSLIATGAGAIVLPLWSVWDSTMVRTVRTLLAESRAALDRDEPVFDVVRTLHAYYQEECAREVSRPDEFAERFPVILYL